MTDYPRRQVRWTSSAAGGVTHMIPAPAGGLEVEAVVPLGPERDLVDEIAALADGLGRPLLPWQRDSLRRLLEAGPDVRLF